MSSDVRDFIAAIFARGGTGTCGSVAAGLVIASPFVAPERAQTVFVAGATVACSATGYLMWRRERLRMEAAMRSPGPKP